MGFYEERLIPIIDKVVPRLCETEHMQNIVNGTVTEEVFAFQIKQNYNYLMNFCRSWAIGLAKATDYEELSLWFTLLKGTFEEELNETRRYWKDQVNVTIDELDQTTMAPDKWSYTSHELARAFEGDRACQVLALFPCTILYKFIGLELFPKCQLPEGNCHRYWLEFYTLDWYTKHCARAVKLVNKLCENKSARELAKLEQIFAVSCNYEFIQWSNLYPKMADWPMLDILPQKFNAVEKFTLD